MSFFKTDISAAAIEEKDGGKYMSRSGIYDIMIKIASVEKNEKGANAINFNVDYSGTPTTLYGLKLDNNDGTANYQRAIFNKLCVIAGLENINDPEAQTHKLGKDNKEVDLMVLTEFDDIECKVRIQEEYSKYNDEIKSRLTIRNFYRTDGATAEEISKEAHGETVTVGAKLTQDMEYAENVTYKDGLTAEDVTAWRAANKAARGSTPAPSTSNKPGNLFK